MRYSNRIAFINQIKSAKSAGAMSRVYWISIPHDYERAQVVEEVLSLVAPNLGNLQKWTELDLKSLGNHLESVSLFGDEPIAVLENAEALLKADIASLEKLIPKDFGILICSAKGKSPFSSVVEDVGVVLDLLTEKPWDREKRIQQTLIAFVQKEGKTIAPNALSALLEASDLEEGILQREIEKLLCYVGEKGQITIDDVGAVCRPSKAFAVWQTAEKVVWEKRGTLEEAHFHELIPALRAQLQIGLKISHLLRENAPQEEWSAFLPRVFPKTIEKRMGEAGRLGARYFTVGLKTLFEIEVASRSGSSHLGALLDFFHCTLCAER